MVRELSLAWVTLLSDSPPDPIKPAIVVNNFLMTLIDDYHSLMRRYETLAKDLVNSIQRQGKGIFISTFLVEFKDTPIFREYLEFYKTHNLTLFRYIYSFLLFGKKLKYVDEDLDATAFRGWLENEERLEQWSPPPLVSNVRTIMAWLFKDFAAGTFLPKHGSGSVAERGVWGGNAKCAKMTFSQELSEYVDTVNDHDSLLSCFPGPEAPRTKENAPTASRLTFVPKSYKTSRSICMEPISFMWAQQAVRLWLEDYIKMSKLRHHIFIDDQTCNQRLCRQGAITGSYDTLDLSSASDSVHLDLVKSIFPQHVLHHLLGTRSPFMILPDGSSFKPTKFAPMGSALCFPTQSIIYAAVIMTVAFAKAYGRDVFQADSLADLDLDAAYTVCFGEGRDGWHNQFGRFLVYGDDLILHNAMGSQVVRALTSLGFLVNEDKSFRGNRAFRESCGKHYLLGVDVTPIHFSTKWFAQRLDIAALSSAIEMANLAFADGYENLRRQLVRFCLYYDVAGVKPTASGRNPILFTSDPDQSTALMSHDAHNHHLEKRTWIFPQTSGVRVKNTDTHIRFQRTEYRSVTIEPKEKRELSDFFDNYHLNLWWRARVKPVGSGELLTGRSAHDTRDCVVRWRWSASYS